MSETGRSREKQHGLRVMLCHEAPVMRGGLRTIINAESDMAVIAEVDRIDDALPRIHELRPEVIITELSIDGGAALDAMRIIKNESPGSRILVLSSQTSGEFFTLAMRAGADGYLTRDAEPAEVVNAVRCLNGGQNYVNASIVTLLVSTYVCESRRGELGSTYEDLSSREKEILCLAASGHTNNEIADMLRLSNRTIHNVRARLMEKLGLHDRLELLRYALRRGIIHAGDM